MPADREDPSNVDEINRLVALGLNVIKARAVASGKIDEASAVARADEDRAVDFWCRGKKEVPAALVAVWDHNPENFYFAFDGAYPEDHASADFVLIEANVDDVNLRLTHTATRDKDPWHKKYKRKSYRIAYRWLHGRGVTPPLLGEVQGEICIIGGMHRFHLAKHYGTTRMPFLVRKAELAAVLALIPSATCVLDHTNK
jgi:hypothetical protein